MSASAAPAAPRITIPLSRPTRGARQDDLVLQSLASGRLAGDGPFTRACEELLGRHLDGARVLLTTSCTHALELAAMLLDIGPGDEVIVPSFTFTSTAAAFLLRGASLRFADVRPDTLNIDERHVATLITERTRAIVPVHYAGIAANMDALARLTDGGRIAIVEDAAHALFGSYRGRPLGAIGDIGTFSFHETKNFSCGEGGALVTRNAQFVERAEILREKGTNRRQFLRGQVDKYTWMEAGSSYVIAEPLAALLLSQLEEQTTIQAKRRRLWERYRVTLAEWAEHNGVSLPVIPSQCEPAWHLFHLLLPSPDDRDRFLRELTGAGIGATFHYIPLHLAPVGRRLGCRNGQLPVTEAASARLARIPLFTDLTEAEQDSIIAAVLAFRAS